MNNSCGQQLFIARQGTTEYEFYCIALYSAMLAFSDEKYVLQISSPNLYVFDAHSEQFQPISCVSTRLSSYL